MSLDNLKEGVMAIVFIALIVAALALTLDGFQDGIESDNPCTSSVSIWNATDASCYDDDGTLNTTVSPNYQYNITQEGLSGTANASGYLDTIGTLLGVAALVAIVIGAFYFARR